MISEPQPLRVLQVFGALDCGGAETLIMQVYRQLDRRTLQFDFVVDVERACYYDAEIARLGGRIFHLPHPAQAGMRAYGQALAQVLRTQGPFCAVHSHVQHFGGMVMQIARQAHIPVRIAHSHNTQDGSPNTWQRALYRQAMQHLIRWNATHLLGCSRRACEALFGPACWRDTRVSVLPNAFTLPVFAHGRDTRAAMREQLGIPATACVLLHVGRLMRQKNHQFLLELFAAWLKREPQAHLILVGEGPLQPLIEQQITELDLVERVHLLGVRDDVPALMGMADVFVFPSLFEGLGIVVLEAQAAGLPCVVSSSVPSEADLGLGMLRSLALHASPAKWLTQIQAALQTRVVDWSERQTALQAAGYDIRQMAQDLTRCYGAQTQFGHAAVRTSC